MAFDASRITEIFPPRQDFGQVVLTWTSDALAPGESYQVYVNTGLVYSGTSPFCQFPTVIQRVRIDVGVVGPGEGHTDFSASLAPGPRSRTRLTWDGGSFEGDDIAGFRVYGSSGPGMSINYAIPLATIPAYPGGIVTDGGVSAVSLYEWTSGVLRSGVWWWGIVPYDFAGNQGTSLEKSDVISVPPTQGPFFPDGTRLHYIILHPGDVGYLTAYNPLPEARLDWTPATA